MALDPRFVVCPSLQNYLVDKDTGGPLSGGIVTFYEDNSRTILKPVYQLSGVPPYSTASFVQLNNPIILTSVGTFADNNGNDIVIYLFPYDGTPATTTNTIDLYYVTVYSSAGVFQFSREAWPPNVFSSIEPIVNNEIINYIPNGQFLLHNNIPSWSGNAYTANLLPSPTTFNNTLAVPASADVTPIGQGGWTFQVPHSTTSINTITFNTLPIASNPDISADPRFALTVACTSFSMSDTFKDLCIEFPDVNKFASDNGAPYTFSFQAQSLNGLPIQVGIRLLKYFGSGGSPSASTDTPFGSGTSILTIPPGSGEPPANVLNISGTFGNNASATLGANNDDYLQIAIRFPVNSVFNAQLTDFVLTSGEVVIQGFPVTTNAEMLSQSTTGWLPTPNPDGSNLYLPLVLTPEGTTYDHSQIGKICAQINAISIGELYCDGSTYKTSGYSTDGIPYSRLQRVLLAASTQSGNFVPLFGTGSTFATAYLSSTYLFYMFQNKFGTGGNISVPTDVSSGLVFTAITPGTAAGFGGVASLISTSSFQFYNNAAGSVTAVADGAGGAATNFTFAQNYNNSSALKSYFVVSGITAASALSGGDYFTFYAGATQYNPYYTINGAGVAPSVGGTNILIALLSTDSIFDVASKTTLALSGGYGATATSPAASSITGGSYWTFGTSLSKYYVWYKVSGVGNDPLVPSSIGIEVDILSSYTSAQVLAETALQIDLTYFQVPDYRGLFFRGWDPNSTWDLESASRFSQYGIYPFGDSVGTTEIFNIQSHLHSYIYSNLQSGGSNAFQGGPSYQNTNVNNTTGLTGAGETIPVNTSVYYVIKY